MTGLYPVKTNLKIGVNELDMAQHLATMFFNGVVEGEVKLALTAAGVLLLFTNAESATFVELDQHIVDQFLNSVGVVLAKIQPSINWGDHLSNYTIGNHSGWSTPINAPTLQTKLAAKKP